MRRTDAALGIAFDGDGDRIGIVDTHGDVVFGDKLLALFGRELRVGYIARTLYESLGDSQVDRLLDTLVSCESRDGIISGEFSFDWHSRLILRAITHRDLGRVIRSFGPSVVPFLSKMVSNRASW